MIMGLIMAGASIAFVLFYLTMAVATTRTSRRRAEAEHWNKSQRDTITAVLAGSVLGSWLYSLFFFAFTTSAFGTTSSDFIHGHWTVALGISLGAKVTLGTAPLAIASVALCIWASSDSPYHSARGNQHTATAMGVLWPYVLFAMVSLRAWKVLFAGPMKWGTAIADVPVRREVAAARALHEKQDAASRTRLKEIEVGIEPIEGL